MTELLTSTDQAQLEIYILLAYSMAVPLRSGLLSVGPAALSGLGAYSYALLSIHTGIDNLLRFVISVAICTIAGALLALPLSRIRGMYTSIATLAFVVIATGIEGGLSWTGGSLGLYDLPFTDLRLPLVVAIILVMASFFWLDHSTTGRRLDVVASSPSLAMTSGISVGKYRLGTLVYSSAIAGFAGACTASTFYLVSPDGFNFYFGISITAFAVVGGAFHWAGPLLGAAILGYLQLSLTGLTSVGQIIAGLAMAAIVIYYPQGIGGVIRKVNRARITPRIIPSLSVLRGLSRQPSA